MPDTDLVIDIVTPLTSDLIARRDALDKEMDEKEGSVVAYFRALMEYRNKKLWKGVYDNFEHYLSTRRKKIGRGRASQLIQYVQVIDRLTGQPGVDVLPESERQTRELKSLQDPVRAAAAWLAAQLASGTDQPSNTWVKSAVETLEQAGVKDGFVQGSGEAEIPADAVSVVQQTANIELERVQRMIDHIRANRKTKPKAILIGKPTNQWTEVSGLHYLTICVESALPLGDFDKLYAGGPLRFVVYEIPVPQQKGTQP